jgi:hypothetical protein
MDNFYNLLQLALLLKRSRENIAGILRLNRKTNTGSKNNPVDER